MSYLLKLYVTGNTPSSKRAVENLKQICTEILSDEYDIRVIDVLKEPNLAEDEKIIATPTLIKTLPPPMRKIIGDLSDHKKVLLGLDLVEEKKEEK